MTLAEILVAAPLAIVLVATAVALMIFAPLFVIGLPFFIIRLYRNRKQKTKINVWEIFMETYF